MNSASKDTNDLSKIFANVGSLGSINLLQKAAAAALPEHLQATTAAAAVHRQQQQHLPGFDLHFTVGCLDGSSSSTFAKGSIQINGCLYYKTWLKSNTFV